MVRAVRPKVDGGPWRVLPFHFPGCGAVPLQWFRKISQDLRDDARAYGPAALPEREAESLVHCDGRDELERCGDVVPRHDHLGALRQLHDAGDVGRADEELRAVPVEEGRVAAALLLGQDVDLPLEARGRRHAGRLDDHLPAGHLVALDPAQEQPAVVAGLALVQVLLEHLHARHRRAPRLAAQADDLDLVAHLDDALLHPARHHRPAALDAEDILHRHREGPVQRARGLGQVRVHARHQRQDGVLADGVVAALQRGQGRPARDGDVVAGVLVEGEELAELHLHQVDELLVVHRVHLVQEAHEVWDAHLAREEDVLARLGHRAVCR
mmetsp:Transcript_5429/g.14160  ORF Transcript_5429/g.14160 Transcript_5429/m.14160 type:complete len:326 (-) Transcript_5429:406-1383(-)